MLCVRECPDWCIEIDSHVEITAATEPRGRDRSVNVLDRFAIDYALCMYCGICVEVCPFDALHWSPVSDYSGQAPTDLVHERERLGSWEASVPEPPALDPAALADPDPVRRSAPRG
jgi:NADH-quinone oxidoreductase subunit I